MFRHLKTLLVLKFCIAVSLQQDGSGFKIPADSGLSVQNLYVLSALVWVFCGHSGFFV